MWLRAWMYEIDVNHCAWNTLYMIECLNGDIYYFVKRLERIHRAYLIAGKPSRNAIKYIIATMPDCLLVYVMTAVAISEAEFVEAFLNLEGYQQFVHKHIHTLIDCAIDCDSSPEVKLLLMDYKHRNGLYREPKFEL